jgi:glutathione S-transferase
MTITLYHCKGSRSVRTLWTLLELGIDHQLVTLPFPPRVREKDYLRVNPLGTVPCLLDGPVRMTESAATCQYLVDRYGPNELAVAREELDYPDYLDWLHRSEATLTFPQTIYLRYTALEPEERRSAMVSADYQKWFLSRLRFLESSLEGKNYLCSDRFTAADICVGYALHLAQLISIAETFSPNIARYWDRLRSRPAFMNCL